MCMCVYIYIYNCICIYSCIYIPLFPKQCLHNGVLTFGVQELAAAATAHAAVGRDLRFDAPAVDSREFRCVSTLPLWFRANSVAFRCSPCGFARIPASSGVLWPLLASSVLGGRLGCGPQRHTRWGGAFVSTVSREFRCISTLPLWFRVAFRRSRCGFARIPASSGLLWPLWLRSATAHAVGRGLRFNAPAVVSREFRCVSTLPLWFRANSVLWLRANSGLFWRVLASSGLLWGAA